MEKMNEKMSKQENTLTKILRKIIKQKDDSLAKSKQENDELRQLILKQQSLLNKLNEENVKLSEDMVNIKTNSVQVLNTTSRRNDKDREDLMDQNKSLKEQLLVSQQYNSQMSNELNQAIVQVKQLTKRLLKYE